MPQMPSQPTMFAAPVRANSKKALLIEVAQALGLPTDGICYEIFARIDEHLKNTPDLVNNPRFQGLFTGRASNPKKGSSKNSGDKAEEDALEEQRGYREGVASTAAHKKLIEQDYKTDPDPQFVKLDSGAPETGRLKEEAGSEADEDKTSPPPSVHSDDLLDDDRHSGGKPQSPAKPKAVNDGIVMLVFEHENNRQIPTREGHVSDVPVFLDEKEDGDLQYSARLSDLLPLAFKQDPELSPMKNRNTRLYRRGLADPESHMALGQVEEVLDPERPPRALKIEHLNRYPLEKCGSNMFKCRLFYKNDEGVNGDKPKTSVADNDEPIIIESDADSSSPIPLHIARARATDRKIAEANSADKQKEPKPGFYNFLREHLKVTIEGLPTERATNMKIVMARYKIVQDALAKLEGWKRRNGIGGYQVPPFPHKYGEFANVGFKKEDIRSALCQKNTSANSDENLLSLSNLHNVPKALDWVKDPAGSAHRDRFENMTRGQFTNYVNKRKGTIVIEISSDRDEGASSSKTKNRKGEGKRRRTEASEEDEESDDDVRRRKAVKKGKKKAVNSSDMDDSD